MTYARTADWENAEQITLKKNKKERLYRWTECSI